MHKSVLEDVEKIAAMEGHHHLLKLTAGMIEIVDVNDVNMAGVDDPVTLHYSDDASLSDLVDHHLDSDPSYDGDEAAFPPSFTKSTMVMAWQFMDTQ